MEWNLTQQANLDELKALRKWYSKQPKLVQKATGMMLNNFAFGTRTAAIVEIGATMTVRNPTYVASRVRVTKTSLSTSINQQRSYVGSIAGARFSGWVEQELGATTQRNRFGTVASRGGDISKQMRPSNRLKPGTDVVKISDYHPRGGDGNYGGFLAMLYRRKERKLIKIKGGFYKLPGSVKELAGPTTSGMALHKALELMQEMKRKQPKRNRWLRRARAVYFKQTDLSAMWKLTLARLVAPPPKR